MTSPTFPLSFEIDCAFSFFFFFYIFPLLPFQSEIDAFLLALKLVPVLEPEVSVCCHCPLDLAHNADFKNKP